MHVAQESEACLVKAVERDHRVALSAMRGPATTHDQGQTDPLHLEDDPDLFAEVQLSPLPPQGRLAFAEGIQESWTCPWPSSIWRNHISRHQLESLEQLVEHRSIERTGLHERRGTFPAFQ